MSSLRTLRKDGEWYHRLFPDLTMLLKFEMSSCTREEIIVICQNLIDSDHVNLFNHPLRRICYDLALGGFVSGLLVPAQYLQLTMDPERPTILDTTVN